MATKRIKDLTNTATSSTLDADQYAVVDGSTGTFKTKLSELATWIHGRWASFVNALTAKTSFASGDKIAVVNGSTATAMGKDYLLRETAENALTGTVAPAFDPTRDNTNPYKAGETVIYNGQSYIFVVDHYGNWTASHVVAMNAIKASVGSNIANIEDVKLNGTRGKNLFNKDCANKRSNSYAQYNNGQLRTLADYSAYVIPVEAGVQLSFNTNSLHGCSMSVIPDLIDAPIGTILPGYIEGFLTSNVTPYTTPVGTKCIIVSIADSSKGSLQVEVGSTKTSFEPYKFGLNIEDVFGLQSELDKKVDGSVGKNLLNINTPNKKGGVYVRYNDGNVQTLSGYTAYVVEIPENVTKISINQSSAHVCAFSSIVDMPNATGSILGYLGGVTGASNQGWTLPAGTKCIIVSVEDTKASTTQVESGESSTSFQPYFFGITWDEVKGKPELHVGVGYQYQTIQAAADAANDGDTIIVHEGTYDEALDVKTKFLRIIGVSKKNCILTHSSGDYYYPPLEIAKGYVSNMTIKATGTTLDEGATMNAYCVHIDYDEETGQNLQFVNCDFENDIKNCVGIGLRENFTVEFLDCQFVTHWNSAAPVYCHEQQADNKGGQKIRLINCSMYCDANSGHVVGVRLQETGAYNGNTMTILMQRCILKNKNGFSPAGKAVRIDKYGDEGTGGEGSGGSGYLGSKGWFLDPLSELNNESIANSSEQ